MAENSFKSEYYEKMAGTVIRGLEKRNMEGYFLKTREEALEKIMNLLKPGASVGYGGSVTLDEIGFFDKMKNSDVQLIGRPMRGVSKEVYKEFYSKVAVCDFFFMSSNAITLDGELVNVDGSGNRVSCLIHGPENVVIVAGMNKVVPTLEDAKNRVRCQAAAPNCIRLNRDTPCSKTGKCGDCLGEDSICAQMVITRRSMSKGRIKVILVGEELGY